jgi:hypothetical protein
MRVAEVETLIPDYLVLVELSSCSTGGADEAQAGAELPYDKTYRAAMKERKNHKIHVCAKADEAKAE